MKTATINNKNIMALIFPTIICFGLIAPLPVRALSTADEATASSAEVDPGPETQEETFVYAIEGRPDPFEPFITKEAASTNMDEIVPIAEQLTGMQLFEPGQLTLVAIVIAANSDFAMAEDFTGKGYILEAGMKIGKRGTITAIEPNQVVIEETAFTRAGEKLTSKIVMLLKKEGEE